MTMSFIFSLPYKFFSTGIHEKRVVSLDTESWYSSMDADKVVLTGNVVHHCWLKIEMHLKMIGGDNRMVNQTFARSN